MQTTVPREDNLAQFKTKKYLGLETYRRNGQPVFTAMWFVTDNGFLYILTYDLSGKAKRIRSNPHVRVVPIKPSGKPDGEWVEGVARIVEEPRRIQVKRMMDAKYGFLDKAIAGLYRLVTRRHVANTVVSIRV